VYDLHKYFRKDKGVVMWRWSILLVGLSTIAGLAGGLIWGGMAASLTLLGVIGWQLARHAWVTVPEESAAVVIDPDRGRFLRLLPPGRHRLRPFVERVEALLPLGSETAVGRCRAYSDGGLPLTLSWQAVYQLEPDRLAPGDQTRLARKLARKHGQLLASEAVASLQQAMSTTPLHGLLGSGGRGRLERDARQAAAVELGRFGITLKRLRVVDIDLPPDVTTTLAAAHERAVEAESRAAALTRLQAVISEFSEADMQRLTELERLRLLGQNGLAYGWPGPTVIDVPGPARRPAAVWN
jgi:regulator of protease activity HflC (stomatin/prohibitin superfamily)